MTYIIHVHDIIGFQKRHLQYAPLFHVDYFFATGSGDPVSSR